MDLLEGSVADESTILAPPSAGREEAGRENLEGGESVSCNHGLLMGKGTVVGATIMNAPSWRKNKRRERDVEMGQTRQGKQWFYGVPPG